MELAQSSEGLSLKLTAVNINGRTLAPNSLPAAPDAITERNNATLQRRIEAARDAARVEAAVAGRLVVLSGSQLNVPSGTRLIFTLSAPILTGQ